MLFYRQKHDHQPVADTLQNIGGAVKKSYMAANFTVLLVKKMSCSAFQFAYNVLPIQKLLGTYRNYWAHTLSV